MKKVRDERGVRIVAIGVSPTCLLGGGGNGKPVPRASMINRMTKRSGTIMNLPVRYESPNVPLSAIRRYARRVAKRFKPNKIILFGSYAYGTPNRDSDVDLMVIMPASNEINQSVRIWRALDAPFSLDLFVRTPEKLHRRLQENDWFLREVVEKGKVLYAKGDGAVGNTKPKETFAPLEPCESSNQRSIVKFASNASSRLRNTSKHCC